MELGTRRIVHCNLTAHPTAEWTLQQFREAIPTDHAYRFLVRDRDSIFSAEVDDQLKVFGLRVLRTPLRAPQANAYCERLVGTVRRECLDFMIPLGERHLSKTLAEWVRHYNQGRPHSSLGPGIPEPVVLTRAPLALHQEVGPLYIHIYIYGYIYIYIRSVLYLRNSVCPSGFFR